MDRFYIETGTQFSGNTIQMKYCKAAPTLDALNSTYALSPLVDYCADSTYDYDYSTHSSPGGASNIARFSFRKFKFVSGNDLFVDCQMSACETLPCGGECYGASAENATEIIDLSGGSGAGSEYGNRRLQSGGNYAKGENSPGAHNLGLAPAVHADLADDDYLGEALPPAAPIGQYPYDEASYARDTAYYAARRRGEALTATNDAMPFSKYQLEQMEKDYAAAS